MPSRDLCVRFLVAAVLVACGCGKTDKVAPADPGELAEPRSPSEPAEPAEPAEDSAGLPGREFVPSDALFVAALSPNRILSRPHLAETPVEQILRKLNNTGLSAEMPFVPTAFLSAAGVPLSDVERVIHVVTGIRGVPDMPAPRGDDETPSANKPAGIDDGGELEFFEPAGYDVETDPFSYGHLVDAHVIRLTRPVPRDSVLAVLFRPQEISLAGKTYFGQGRDTGAFALHFVDERTMIVGEEQVLRGMLAGNKPRTPLSDAVDALDPENDVQCVANVTAMRRILPIDEIPVPPSPEVGAAWKALIENAATASLSLRLDARPSARLVLIGHDADAGGRINETLSNVLAAARRDVKELPAKPPADRVFEYLYLCAELVYRAVHNSQLARVEARVELAVDDLMDTSKLISLLQRIDDTALSDIELLPAVATPSRNSEDEETAAAIRCLIPAAAGFPYEILAVIAQSETTPRASDLVDQSVSVLAFNYMINPPGFYPAYEEEFSYDGAFGAADPAELATELARSRYLGYVTMIQPDRITGFTCEVDGETAAGSVSFEVPEILHGEAEYTAGRVDGRWRITEFRMPVHQWRFVQQDDGSWEWLDRYGNFYDRDRFPHQTVVGKITFQGEPFDAFLQFYQTPDPVMPGGVPCPASGGEYHTQLVPGTYRVVVRTRDPAVAEKYGAPGTTDLEIEVKEGVNRFNFELKGE